ncbi:MAG: tetratricopeptide repeat protein [Promethearchaeota archaeon]
MSIPFSTNEIKSLRQLIEKHGWNIHGYINNHYRYSIRKNNLIIFSIKIPATLPLKLNIPFEVAQFQVSIAFKLWNLDQKAYKIIIYLLKMLRNITDQASIEHNWLITETEKIKLVNLLNSIMPDIITNENERAWLNRIRISLMNKRDQFPTQESVENVFLKKLIELIRSLGLKPTFNQPWELNKGIPKIRTPETLFFSNDEPYDEFFILEKGYLSYFKDLEFNKFYVRSFFDTYTPYILLELYRDNPNFKLELYMENWIKFTRLLLNSTIEILKLGKLNHTDFIQFRPEKELTYEDFEENQNNFPFSSLHYETLISKELYPLHYDLLNTPPTDFEVIESSNYLIEAQELLQSYKFEEASALLEEALKIFNKHKQRKIVVSILLKLTKIASLLNQSNIELNYLQNALEVSKSGDVPLEFIIKIHYKLGKIYFKIKDYTNALNHFNLIMDFLEEDKLTLNEINKDEYLGMANLYLGLIKLEHNNATEAKNNLKTAYHIGNTISPKVKFKYHLFRAIYYKNKNKYSQALKVLKLAFSGINLSQIKYQNLIVDLLLEMSEFYIHYRKDTKRAQFYLQTTEKLISKRTIPGLHRAIRWNLLMSDFFKFMAKNSENSAYYFSQSRILKAQLKSIGVLD